VLLEYLTKITNNQSTHNRLNKPTKNQQSPTAQEKESKNLIPSLKPLLNLRGKWRRYLILPVPVVFLRIAFTLQLSKTHHNNQKTPSLTPNTNIKQIANKTFESVKHKPTRRNQAHP
jgi:hypothetical protein